MTDPAAELCAELDASYGAFPDIIAANAKRFAERLALRDEYQELTWAETGTRVERIAAALQDSGLEPGQAVAILGTSSADYALTFLAAVRAGGVAAPLTTSASAGQLAAMVRDSGARHLFIDRAKRDELGEAFFDDLGETMQIVMLDEDLRPGPDSWMAAEGREALPFSPAPGDPFNIIYSSGTTGTPKGIVHSHAMRWTQFATTALSLARNFEETQGGVQALTSTPLYSNTTMVAFLPTLLAGGCVTIMGRFDAQAWLGLAQDHAISLTMLVPVQYRRLLDVPRFDDFDLSALRLKYCTSAPFPAELKRRVLDRMPGALIEIYGMTEGGVTCLLPAHEFPDKLHTVGRPAPGHALKVIGEDDEVLDAGQAGQLVGRSGAMMIGYRNRPEATAEALWTDPETGEDWMRMGDIGRIDADGFVELVGRAKDVIISGGFNIYPVDLEAALEQEPEIAEAAVIGVPSDAWGETPVGFVVLESGAREEPVERLRERVNGRLGKTQRLSELHEIAEMPRSHIGKLLKTELRAVWNIMQG